MKPTLQIEPDLPFQYRQWRVERAGWAIIGLIILAALAGVFGHHPFARATAQTHLTELLSLKWIKSNMPFLETNGGISIIPSEGS